MAKASRSKTRGANFRVPQTREDAATAVREIGEVNREIARIEADMNDELARIKEEFVARANPLRDQVEATTEGLKMWAEANRAVLTGGDKTKTVSLGTGEIKWRNRPPAVKPRGKLDELLDRLRTLGLGRFIRVSEAIDKEAMLREPEVARTVPGISIASAGEDFVVEPFETELV